MSLPKTSSMYSVDGSIKDFILQLFGFLAPSSKVYRRKLNLESKINTMLSINVMLEKFYFLEILINYLINDEQQIFALKMYPSQIERVAESNHDIFAKLPMIDLLNKNK
jgi:hypothetical protein